MFLSLGSINLYLGTHSSNFPSEKWNRSMDHLLLEVCAKYKKELSCPNVKKNPIVWRKIAGEFSRKHLRCPKECNSRFLISESECMNKIEMLRDKYHAQKGKTVVSRKMARFCNVARNAFGILENSGKPKNIAISKKKKKDNFRL